MKPGLCDLFILSAILVSLPASGDTVHSGSFTNTAGEVTVGEVITVTNQLITIRTGQGMIQAIPLQTFPAAEQERLLLGAGMPLPLPPGLEQRRGYLRDLSVRTDRLQLSGKLSAEKATQRKQALTATWQRGLHEAFTKGQISTALHEQWLNVPLQ